MARPVIVVPADRGEVPTMDVDARRAVLRAFSYGLYAVGVRAGERFNLFTANWLTQVSFEPPLVALAVEQDAYSLELIRESGRFAVSLLRADQREVAMTLGRAHRKTPAKATAFAHEPAPSGCPILLDSPAWFDCRVTGSLPAGDHILFTAEVTDVGLRGTDVGEVLQMKPAG